MIDICINFIQNSIFIGAFMRFWNRYIAEILVVFMVLLQTSSVFGDEKVSETLNECTKKFSSEEIEATKIFGWLEYYLKPDEINILSLRPSAFDRVKTVFPDGMISKTYKQTTLDNQVLYPVVSVKISKAHQHEVTDALAVVISSDKMVLVLDKEIDFTSTTINYGNIPLSYWTNQDYKTHEEYNGKHLYLLSSPSKLKVSQESLDTSKDKQELRNFLSLVKVPHNHSQFMLLLYPPLQSVLPIKLARTLEDGPGSEVDILTRMYYQLYYLEITMHPNYRIDALRSNIFDKAKEILFDKYMNERLEDSNNSDKKSEEASKQLQEESSFSIKTFTDIINSSELQQIYDDYGTVFDEELFSIDNIDHDLRTLFPFFVRISDDSFYSSMNRRLSSFNDGVFSGNHDFRLKKQYEGTIVELKAFRDKFSNLVEEFEADNTTNKVLQDKFKELMDKLDTLIEVFQSSTDGYVNDHLIDFKDSVDEVLEKFEYDISPSIIQFFDEISRSLNERIKIITGLEKKKKMRDIINRQIENLEGDANKNKLDTLNSFIDSLDRKIEELGSDGFLSQGVQLLSNTDIKQQYAEEIDSDLNIYGSTVEKEIRMILKQLIATFGMVVYKINQMDKDTLNTYMLNNKHSQFAGCTGTVISSSTMITAAHCIKFLKFQGTVQVKKGDEWINSEDWYVHPLYNSSKLTQFKSPTETDKSEQNDGSSGELSLSQVPVVNDNFDIAIVKFPNGTFEDMVHASISFASDTKSGISAATKAEQNIRKIIPLENQSATRNCFYKSRDVPVEHGDSGATVNGKDNKIMGIVSGTAGSHDAIISLLSNKETKEFLENLTKRGVKIGGLNSF